jgi:hypothetical protein
MRKAGLANVRVSKILDMSRDFQAHRNNIVHIHNRISEEHKIKKRAEKIEKMLQ